MSFVFFQYVFSKVLPCIFTPVTSKLPRMKIQQYDIIVFWMKVIKRKCFTVIKKFWFRCAATARSHARTSSCATFTQSFVVKLQWVCQTSPCPAHPRVGSNCIWELNVCPLSVSHKRMHEGAPHHERWNKVRQNASCVSVSISFSFIVNESDMHDMTLNTLCPQ